MIGRAGLVVAVLIASAPGAAVADVPLSISGEAVEGGLLIGRTAPGARVSLDGVSVPVSSGGDFLLGFGREAAGRKRLRVDVGADTVSRVIDVADRDFRIERIDGLPRRKVRPNPADMERIRREKAAINDARARSDPEPAYLRGFRWPASGRVSGVYGSQRILNGTPRRPHYGTDVAAPVGTPVAAVAGGRIAFVHPGMFFNGKTVLIDHGLGLRSIYIHLSETKVRAGERVAAGQAIGAIGRTGRTTGPHLHFEISLGATPLDPQVVLGPMPE